VVVKNSPAGGRESEGSCVRSDAVDKFPPAYGVNRTNPVGGVEEEFVARQCKGGR